MAYERYGRGDQPQDDRYGRRDQQGGGRAWSGNDGSGGQNRGWSGTQGGGQGYGDDDRYSQGGYGGGGRGQSEDRGGWGGGDEGRGFTGGDDYYRGDREQVQGQGQGGGGRGQGGYGRQPQGYNYQDRGFVSRAGDEVRSWFGDEEAERRREADARQDERQGGTRETHHHDRDYHDWRNQQVAAFDRDYAEYRQHNQAKFHNEFSSWRTQRQGQRDQLTKVEEHMDVVGSDGEHVGTVDKVRGDRVILTKNDADVGGRHHSVPSTWIQSVEGKVTLARTAAEAKQQWRDEERTGAMFGNEQGGRQDQGTQTGGRDGGGTDLNRSFSGTY